MNDTESMNIFIENCNNIESGKISIAPGKLNIKYAHNGTGKTTISKSIVSVIENTGDLTSLKPFKPKGKEKVESSITGLDDIKSVMVFDEEYLNQYVFLKDEILKDSFNIFIRTPEYETHMENIRIQLSDLHEVFKDNETIESLLNNLDLFVGGFGRAKSGLAKNGSIYKGLGGGNKLKNIPADLSVYSDFLKKDTGTVKWLKWHFDGKNHSDESHNCPYCAHNIDNQRAAIRKVSEEYDSKAVEHLLNMLEAFESLSQYMSDNAKIRLNNIANNLNGISKEDEKYLNELKDEAVNLRQGLETVKNANFDSLKNVDMVADELESYKIHLLETSSLNSSVTNGELVKINALIDVAKEKAGQIQGAIRKQNSRILCIVEKYEIDINSFLDYAGYKYRVSLKGDSTENIRLVMRHIDADDTYTGDVKQHLSYGEKNALALVLFMYDAINKKPDLIILDDPISSFDGNKKFAILHRLFTGSGDNSFFNKTVLLLTHEFSTIIDVIYNLKRDFNAPVASYLENNDGNLVEKSITKSDIQSSTSISKENIGTTANKLSKIIYLRRLLELDNNKGSGYQLVSSYLHKRQKPIRYDNDNSHSVIDLTEDEIAEAINEIQNHNISFGNYSDEVTKLTNKALVCEYDAASSNYEKLHIFRILLEGIKGQNKVFQKFINETYHIENDYLFQLNPLKYEIVPSYIIKECDKNIADIRQALNVD